MSISIGHIITIVGLLITVITWSSTVKAEVIGLDKRMKEVEDKIDKFTEIYIATNNMNYKLGDFEKRITALENRVVLGFVKSN